MKYSSLLIIIVAISMQLNAQEVSRQNFPFTANGSILDYAMAGGLNAPQFSEVDLNNDGIMDLFAFDRAGDVKLTFRGTGSSYEYKSFYAKNFPNLRYWALLRDFDQDGVMDIFSYSDVPSVDGVIVYKGFYNANNEIAFERFNFYELTQNIIPLQQTNGAYTNLYVSFEDIPGIVDMDGDGDLDILTFGIGGGYIYLYKNQSVEYGHGLDSLRFTLETNCWGYVYESGQTEVITTSETIGDCPGLIGDPQIDNRHAGSTLCPMDVDNDGDQECLIGDISFTNLNLLDNGGTSEEAFIVAQDTFWPSNSFSADIPIFPAGFHVDMDADGIKDIIASPNLATNAEDYNNMWFYKNIGDNENKTFELQQKDYMIDEMVDHGTGSHPEFVDIDQDGLLDLLVGTFSFFVPGGEKDPRIAYYKNIGTASDPAFELVDDDFLEMSSFGTTSLRFAPTSGDLDGDGDLDLLIGEEYGGLFFVENTAGPGNPMTFAPLVYSYFDIDVTQASSPFIVDLNRDGLLDLVIGERNGNVNYFQNLGTVTNPQFEKDPQIAPNIEFLGGIDTRIMGSTTGYSSPVVLDFESGYVILTGSKNGKFELYNNIDGNLNGTFDEIDSDYGGLKREGANTNVTVADLNNDGVLDMLIGNTRGGISGYRSSFNLDGTTQFPTISEASAIHIFPNPATDQLTIEITNQEVAFPLQFRIFDVVGREIKNGLIQSNKTFIPVQSFSSGLYFVELTIGGKLVVEKIIVQ